MSELDLKLKVASRRLLWRMGYTTRLDVPLRAFHTGQATDTKGRSNAPQAFTDLDVLGLTLVGGSRVESAIVDCKTSLKGSTERMFWIRGVADFFKADAAYMVREVEVSDAARQLSTRLGISALTGPDVLTLEGLYPSTLPVTEEPYSWLFDHDHAAKVLSAFNKLDKRHKPLLEYRQFDYWVYDEHRNLIQMVEHLRASAAKLDPKNPIHLALLFDCAWLYLLSICRAIDTLRAGHLHNLDLGLQMYLLGGPSGYQEKQQLARLFKGLVEKDALPASVHVEPLPDYYGMLRELTTRVYRRPANIVSTLRVLEIATTAGIVEKDADLSCLRQEDAIGSKLAADVLGFLVTSSNLDPGFRTRGRSLLLGEGKNPNLSTTPGDRDVAPEVSDPVLPIER